MLVDTPDMTKAKAGAIMADMAGDNANHAPLEDDPLQFTGTLDFLSVHLASSTGS